MAAALLVYWIISYTSGIACTAVLGSRYLQQRDPSRLRLLAFLACVDAAVLALALREAGSFSDSHRAILGQLAVVGAALAAGTFPRFALSLEGAQAKSPLAGSILAVSLLLAAADLAALFLPVAFGLAAGTCTFVVLVAALYLGLAWITRTQGRGARSGTRRASAGVAWMTVFYALTGLVALLDFFGLLRLLAPRLAGRLVLFPAYFAFLNLFLLRAYASGPPAAREDGASAPASARELERYGISAREAEVLALVAEGRTYREIADQLCVSLATIKSHLTHLYEKTGARNKVELLNKTRSRTPAAMQGRRNPRAASPRPRS